ncbi:MAG: DNA topoisomerase III, partial [Thaumarchaeota archaeon]|nr:DNA topoisomerase III [Nitrososphaerota archaeon]
MAKIADATVYGRILRMVSVIVAEKPSVARRIREALRAEKVLVTSVRGHILDSEFPEGFGWRECSPSRLFDVREFRDEVRDMRSVAELRRIFRDAELLIIATDNDSEGELIGAEILKIWREVKGDAPYRRMRFNSTSYEELRRAWRNLEDDLNWRWVMKALFRQRFDLISGAAFTRLLTLAARRHNRDVRLISWGSCQAPTLWFVVKRERERMNFKPKPFWILKAIFQKSSGERFEAESDRFWSLEDARRAYRRAQSAPYGVVKRFEERIVKILRPTPLRTDDMLRDLTKITGQSASRILQVAEDLYAEGFISYPRTETNRYRPGFNYDSPLRAAVEGLGVTPPSIEAKPRQGRRDDGAHTPIYPIMAYKGSGIHLTVWSYVAKRFLANAFYRDALKRERSAELDLTGIRMRAAGSELVEPGFYEIYDYFKPSDNPIPRLEDGEEVKVISLKLHEGRTRPPKRLTESDLLKLMEENGIGTDATRASFPKLIMDRGYAVRRGKVFKPTDLGLRLIEVLESIDPKLVTPETRRRIEELMSMIESGEITYEKALERAVQEYKPLYLELESK